jgi:hypothetical protein
MLNFEAAGSRRSNALFPGAGRSRYVDVFVPALAHCLRAHDGTATRLKRNCREPLMFSLRPQFPTTHAADEGIVRAA